MSLSKQKIKEIKSLQQPKFRQIYNKFVAEGDKVVTEFVKNPKYTIEELYITSGAEEKYSSWIRNPSLNTTIIHQKDMTMMSGLKTPADVLLVLRKKEEKWEDTLNKTQKAIYLDGVQDPGNVGTIIRIADWFGVSAVIRSADSADFFNPKVVQASMGSMCRVSLLTAGLDECVPYHNTIVGAFMNGEDASSIRQYPDALLVLGSEGKGIRPENFPHITHRITIHGAEGRIADSLNVSVAAGILCVAW